MRRVFHAAGIETTGEGSKVRRSSVRGFHSLRHTWVSKLINAGVSSEVVQAAVGHTNAAQTSHYTRIMMEGVERIRTAMERVGSEEPEEGRAKRGIRDLIAEDRSARQAAEDARAITVEAVESDGDSDAKAVDRADKADDAAVLAQIAKLASALSPETRAKLAGMLA